MLLRILTFGLLATLFSTGCEAPAQNESSTVSAPAPVVKGSPVTIMGRVYDKQTQKGLEGATVKTETGVTTTTNASGNYSIDFIWPEDNESLLFTFSKPGYNPKNLHLAKGKTVLETLLSPAATTE